MACLHRAFFRKCCRYCQFLWNYLDTFTTGELQAAQVEKACLNASVGKKDLAWERYHDLSSQDIAERCRFPRMGKDIDKFNHQFPMLELAAQRERITRSVLKGDLTITSDAFDSFKSSGYVNYFYSTDLPCTYQSGSKPSPLPSGTERLQQTWRGVFYIAKAETPVRSIVRSALFALKLTWSSVTACEGKEEGPRTHLVDLMTLEAKEEGGTLCLGSSSSLSLRTEKAGRAKMAETISSSFSSLSAYSRALRKTPQRLRERAGVVSSAEAELTEVRFRSGGFLRRRLEWYEVVGMGVGGMVGAGIFVTTGSVAKNYSGPAVILSYLLAGFTALLSALCYTDFAVELPIAGGAFSYLNITFGEFAAYFTGANLILEYVLSNAAVARTFLPYIVSAFSTKTADSWRIKVPGLSAGFDQLDFGAMALVLIITIILCYSTKHGAVFNLVVTLIHIIFILFIIIVGFALGNVKNFSEPASASSPGGFTPYGVPGIFNGAAIVYFSYIGYDAVSTMAEEVRSPSTTMPIGVAGSVIIVTILYSMMAASICLLQPYDQIDPHAPFVMAFKSLEGWEWAASFVGVGAGLGILTSLLVSMLGQARYLCVIGRSHVVPNWFAAVHQWTGTPLNATVFLGFWTALFSLFIDLELLLDMVSIGTLFVFYMVANALIFHRHVGQRHRYLWATLFFLGVLTLSALGFVLIWSVNPDSWWGLVFFGSVAVIATIIFYCGTPLVAQEPRAWQLPMVPVVASMSIFLNVFLLGSVQAAAYKRFGLWSAIAVAYYLLYGVHATHDAAEETGTKGVLLMSKSLDMELDLEMEKVESDMEIDVNMEMEGRTLEGS